MTASDMYKSSIEANFRLREINRSLLHFRSRDDDEPTYIG
jgi:hypothetical protein